ncbi:MAG: hypothetical protein PHP45_03435 [Elusimicrobiales bacterium]|nr:hypothetical protein [Elusimicrobiales bacterium]
MAKENLADKLKSTVKLEFAFISMADIEARLRRIVREELANKTKGKAHGKNIQAAISQ